MNYLNPELEDNIGMLELKKQLPPVTLCNGKSRIMLHQRTSQRDIEQLYLAGSGSGFNDTCFHALDTTETPTIGHTMGLPPVE
jgi:hypothetical protein